MPSIFLRGENGGSGAGGRAIKISSVYSGIPDYGNEMEEGERRQEEEERLYRYDMDCKERVLCER